MIKRLIYNLRQKPKESRERVAFGVAIAFTAVVFTVWAYHAPSKFESVLGEDDGSGVGDSSFSSILDQIGDQVGTVKEAIDTLPSDEAGEEEEISGEDAWREFMQRNAEAEARARTEGGLASTSSAMSASTTATTTEERATTTSRFPEPRPVRIVTTSEANANASGTQQTR